MDKCRSVVIASSNRSDRALVTKSCYTELKDERIPVWKHPHGLKYLQ